MQIELQDRRHFAEMERITAQRAERPIPAPRDTIKARTPKIPAFNEGKDEMDAYLLRFERYASAQGWKRESWATDLSALLQGKALDVYALMPQEDAMDYDKLKCALLQRYQLTEEGFKRKYRKCRPETGETFQQFSARLKSYFTRWIDMSGIPKTFEGLQDLMLRDQFTFICNRELELFLREREPTSLEQASKLADSYKEARYVDIVNLTFKNDRGRSRSNSASRSRSPVKRDQIPYNQNSYGRGRGKYYPGLKCYNCGGTHYRRECPELKPGIMKVGAVGHRGRSPTKKVTFQSKDSEVQTTYEDSHEDTTTDVKKCGACLTYTNTVSYSKAAMESKDNLHEKHQVSVSSVSSLSELSTVQGMVEEKSVEVLRDTGCSGVIVSKHVVPEGAYTGRNQTMVMVDYSTRVVPEVKVNIDTPYYKGEVLALCVEKPLVDLIIGNIPGARERNKPDIDWVPTLAVQTRAQKKQEGTHVSMKTPEIVIQEVTPDQIRKAQNEDQSLKVMKARCEAKECLKNASYFIKNNLMYRKFSSPNIERGRLFTQLIVPQQFRKTVMKLAHESIMAGHLAVKRTIQKVLTEFYWPGISSDIKRFCQSCDICQRTVPKGKIIRAPLGKMPRIDVPFKRVATDLIGPLKPVTYSKNRFILTVVDYATRYPEAVPLASIDTETVAEALVSIFSRVGVPSEILSDLGSQYTSSIMKEVSRLLSFKQLVTTPYDPICHVPLERFRRAIVSMLVSVCAQQPVDWGKLFHSSRIGQYMESRDGRVRDKSQVCVVSMADDGRGDIVRALPAEDDRALLFGKQKELDVLVQEFSSENISELPKRMETEKPAREVTQRNVEKKVRDFSSDVCKTGTGSSSDFEARGRSSARFHENQTAEDECFTFIGWLNILFSIVLIHLFQFQGDVLLLMFVLWLLFVCAHLVRFVMAITTEMRRVSKVTDWLTCFVEAVSIISVVGGETNRWILLIIGSTVGEETNWWLWPCRRKSMIKVSISSGYTGYYSEAGWSCVRWRARVRLKDYLSRI